MRAVYKARGRSDDPIAVWKRAGVDRCIHVTLTGVTRCFV
jgi:hypothetical protein